MWLQFKRGLANGNLALNLMPDSNVRKFCKQSRIQMGIYLMCENLRYLSQIKIDFIFLRMDSSRLMCKQSLRSLINLEKN